jgi:hypothetical protein
MSNRLALLALICAAALSMGQVIYKDNDNEIRLVDGEFCFGTIGSNYTCIAADGSITNLGTASADLGAVDADSMTITPSSSPCWCPGDSDAPGADTTVGCICFEYKDGADGSENADLCISAIEGGVEEPEQLCFDESEGAWESTKPIKAPRETRLITAATYTIGDDSVQDAYGATFVNNDNDALTITAPAGVDGMNFKVMNGDGVAGIITLEPDAGDEWVLVGVAGDAGDYIASAGAAGEVAWVFFEAGQWHVEYKVGTWAHEP